MWPCCSQKMYACFKIGAICAPLDVRLKEADVVRDLNKIGPKVFFFLTNTPVRDFRAVGSYRARYLSGRGIYPAAVNSSSSNPATTSSRMKSRRTLPNWTAWTCWRWSGYRTG